MNEESVAQRWNGTPSLEDEATHLDAIAGQLRAAARLLAPVDVTNHQRLGFDPIGLSIRRLVTVLERLARTERSMVERVWLFDGEQPTAETFVPNREPDISTLEVDVFALFLFADLLLEEVAAHQLRKRTGAPGSWTEFVDYLDSDADEPELTTTVRELNLVVRSSRNVLVAHPAEGFELRVAIGPGGQAAVMRVAPMDAHSEAAYEEAGSIMREVATELGMKHSGDWEYDELLGLIGYAGQMERSQRQRLYRAITLAGFGSVPLRAVARLTRDLVVAHVKGEGHRTRTERAASAGLQRRDTTEPRTS